ncbi:MAG: hypothetical protein HQK88_08165 [Nitrospirae bacterium]|nr:hypothetical protein [Nitrospirota bacterium]MBF0534860.1 hypothetical protein [Nitrospirota bacterium]MBF0616775.1 hypothetical protein [Nitrospirota bacterium]
MTEIQLKMILTEAALHVPGSFIEREGVRIGKVALMTCANCMLSDDEVTCSEISARDIYVSCSEEFTSDKKKFLCTALRCPSWSQCAQDGVCRECVVMGAYKRRRKLKK